MAKSGPHGTLRQVSPAAAGETADAEKRNDEYADHVVQTFRVAPSSTLKAEKKIVIPSREAETVKVRHEDVPALAAALARERARIAEAHAAGGLPVQERAKAKETADDTSWIDDRDSFDPESFSSEHPPPMASSPSAVGATEAPRRSRAGLLLALFGVVVVAGGVGMLVMNRQIELPFGLGDPGGASEPVVEESSAPTVTPTTTAAAPPASASDDAPTRETASPVDAPITEAAPAPSASASAPRPAPKRPKRLAPRAPEVYPEF